MVCINPAYRLYELEFALNKVECKVVITAEAFKTSDYLGMLNTLAPELANSKPGALQAEKLPHLRTVVRMGTAETVGMLNFGAVCGLGGEKEGDQLRALQGQLKPDDAINIQFTSGTTGNPKGATLTHCNILNNGYLAGRSHEAYRGRPVVYSGTALSLFWYGFGGAGLCLTWLGHGIPGRSL